VLQLTVAELAETKEAALSLGNEMVDNNIFTHVVKKHRFQDGYLFYSFTEVFLARNRVVGVGASVEEKMAGGGGAGGAEEKRFRTIVPIHDAHNDKPTLFLVHPAVTTGRDGLTDVMDLFVSVTLLFVLRIVRME